MTYATATRGHDTTWYLQYEMVTNDRIQASERRHGPRRPSRRPGDDFHSVPPPEPSEAAAAERTARRVADRTGMDAAALREVLEALGLAEAAAPEPPPAREPFPTGACPHCDRIVHLRKDDTLIAHTAERRAVPGTPHCPGSHTLPRPEATP